MDVISFKSIKIFWILFFLTYMIFGQNKYTITYEYTDIEGHSTISELLINNDESVFMIKDDREGGLSTSSTGEMYYANTDKLSTFMYTNNSNSYIRTLFRKNEVLYKHPNNHLNWVITDDIKKIGDYNCIKASLILHGRSYDVWFTTDIPIAFGPMKLNGLPGLIIEASTEDSFLTIKLLSIKKDKIENNTFSFAKDYFEKYKKKVNDYDTYKKLITEVMIRRKLKVIAIVTEGSTATISFDEDQNAFTRYIIDIPENAIKELQKIN